MRNAVTCSHNSVPVVDLDLVCAHCTEGVFIGNRSTFIDRIKLLVFVDSLDDLLLLYISVLMLCSLLRLCRSVQKSKALVA